MIAGQADLTVSSITGAPLTPTVFRTFRGVRVVASAEFLEPLRANWRITAFGALAFALVVAWMTRAIVARDGAAPPAPRAAAVLLAGGLLTAWLATLAPWAIPPPPIEAAFVQEWLGFDRTALHAPQRGAIPDLPSLLRVPPRAGRGGGDYPLRSA